MQRNYFVLGTLVVVLLAIAVYSGGYPNQILDKVKLGSVQQNITEDARAKNDAVLDGIIANLKKEGAPKDRIIVKSAGGGGGATGEACNRGSYSTNTPEYFVKARIEKVENKRNDDGTYVITYTYAGVDEYEKANSAYPDINPDDLLIIGPVDSSGATPEGTQTLADEPVYTYIHLKNDGGEFSVVC